MAARVGKYLLFDTIGSGAFGKVKTAVHEESGEKVAIKIMDKLSIRKDDLTLNVGREIAIMKALSHKNIVRLRHVLASSTKLYIVLDLITGGELFELIAAKGEGGFEERQARSYFQQLIDGVDYCHSRGVCHRDLKPENLLVGADGLLKITDFGLSSMKGADTTSQLLTTLCGTPHYIAPEIIVRAKDGYDGQKVDAWACGIILFALLAGYLPFDETAVSHLFTVVQRGQVEYPPWISAPARNLISRLLNVDPRARMSVHEVKSHPWFRIGYVPDVPTEAAATNGTRNSGMKPPRRGRTDESRLASQIDIHVCGDDDPCAADSPSSGVMSWVKTSGSRRSARRRRSPPAPDSSKPTGGSPTHFGLDSAAAIYRRNSTEERAAATSAADAAQTATLALSMSRRGFSSKRSYSLVRKGVVNYGGLRSASGGTSPATLGGEREALRRGVISAQNIGLPVADVRGGSGDDSESRVRLPDTQGHAKGMEEDDDEDDEARLGTNDKQTVRAIRQLQMLIAVSKSQIFAQQHQDGGEPTLVSAAASVSAHSSTSRVSTKRDNPGRLPLESGSTTDASDDFEPVPIVDGIDDPTASHNSKVKDAHSAPLAGRANRRPRPPRTNTFNYVLASVRSGSSSSFSQPLSAPDAANPGSGPPVVSSTFLDTSDSCYGRRASMMSILQEGEKPGDDMHNAVIRGTLEALKRLREQLIALGKEEDALLDSLADDADIPLSSVCRSTTQKPKVFASANQRLDTLRLLNVWEYRMQNDDPDTRHGREHDENRTNTGVSDQELLAFQSLLRTWESQLTATECAEEILIPGSVDVEEETALPGFPEQFHVHCPPPSRSACSYTVRREESLNGERQLPHVKLENEDLWGPPVGVTGGMSLWDEPLLSSGMRETSELTAADDEFRDLDRKADIRLGAAPLRLKGMDSNMFKGLGILELDIAAGTQMVSSPEHDGNEGRKDGRDLNEVWGKVLVTNTSNVGPETSTDVKGAESTTPHLELPLEARSSGSFAFMDKSSVSSHAAEVMLRGRTDADEDVMRSRSRDSPQYVYTVRGGVNHATGEEKHQLSEHKSGSSASTPGTAIGSSHTKGGPVVSPPAHNRARGRRTGRPHHKRKPREPAISPVPSPVVSPALPRQVKPVTAAALRELQLEPVEKPVRGKRSADITSDSTSDGALMRGRIPPSPNSVPAYRVSNNSGSSSSSAASAPVSFTKHHDRTRFKLFHIGKRATQFESMYSPRTCQRELGDLLRRSGFEVSCKHGERKMKVVVSQAPKRAALAATFEFQGAGDSGTIVVFRRSPDRSRTKHGEAAALNQFFRDTLARFGRTKPGVAVV